MRRLSRYRDGSHDISLVTTKRHRIRRVLSLRRRGQRRGLDVAAEIFDCRHRRISRDTCQVVSNAIPQPEDEVFIRATPDAGKLSFSVSSLGLKALCGASGSRASRICPTGSLFSWWPQHQTASGVRTCLSPGQDPTPLRPRVPDDLECLTGKQIARDRIVGQYTRSRGMRTLLLRWPQQVSRVTSDSPLNQFCVGFWSVLIRLRIAFGSLSDRSWFKGKARKLLQDRRRGAACLTLARQEQLADAMAVVVCTIDPATHPRCRWRPKSHVACRA